MAYDYDFFVIGAGPGGLAAAKRAAKYGVKVAIAERDHLGGICVNRGCIPKKLMVFAADFSRWLQDAEGYGWSVGQQSFDWQRFVAARNQEVERIQRSQAQALQQAGVEIIRSHAALVDAHTLELEDRKVTASHILIAVGSRPSKPDIPGIEHAVTSKDIFGIEHLPKRFAVIGGGYIGVEFSSIMRGFGADVVLMDQSDCILTGFDDDLRHAVRDHLIDRGIQSLCSTTTKAIEKNSDGFHLTLEGDCPQTITADLVLCAIGRTGNLEHLGLEQVGIETQKGAIVVDDYSRTNVDHIFAVGDCTARLALTPVANEEGRALVDTVFGEQPRQVDYNHVPSAVFARPEAASVGLTEAQARNQLGDGVQCYRTEFTPLFYRLSQHPQKSMIKLVVDRHSERVLGVHLVGEHASEIIQGFAVAVKQGITKQAIDQFIGIHPTSAEEMFAIDN
ncbi:glutathione-disulfide reductase [Oculatella sp. LEGE 06141]|uniref:glutathione-disulfide reductase n=1 Tax=Oculatella sp. LEGE 06141 TaxID=1828648 RepID=UPI00187FBFBD|nr:glutathione-disulfide reductase [Oculatella sp. LEGE 06141]MBE9180131.1 glutathione-disulfide reductase [Oculatella sp. LEGE 06141]